MNKDDPNFYPIMKHAQQYGKLKCSIYRLSGEHEWNFDTYEHPHIQGIWIQRWKCKWCPCTICLEIIQGIKKWSIYTGEKNE